MATYYVDATGGLDTNSGLTEALAWKTLAKVNGVAFAAGDTILFNRGDTWAAQLVPATSGTAIAPITFSAYGAGALPKIWGTSYGVSTARDYVQFVDMDMRGVTQTAGTGVLYSRSMIRETPSPKWGLLLAVGADAAMDHCVVASNNLAGIFLQGALTLQNSIILGNSTYGTNWPGVQVDTTGVLTYDYNLITGNSKAALSVTVIAGGVATDGGHNMVEALPQITSYRTGQAYFVYTFDDDDVPHWRDVAAAIPAGAKFTGFVAPGNLLPGEDAMLAALSAAGHEIANHTYHHDDITLVSAFTVTTTNAAPTIDVDLPTKTLTLATTTPGNTVVVDWSITPQLIADLKAAVVGKGWTITNTLSMVEVDLKALADTAGPQAVPYLALLDAAAYYEAEITDANAAIAAITGIAPTTFSFPYGEQNAGSVTFLHDSGFIGARVPYSSLLASVYIFRVTGLFTNYWKGDGSEATIRASARHLYAYAMSAGMILCLFSHTAAEATPQQIAWLMDEIQNAGGQWITFEQALTAIRADHATADGGYTWTKAYPDVSDYRLNVNSPCIGAGTGLGVWADSVGRPLIYHPDIGAYDTVDWAMWDGLWLIRQVAPRKFVT